MNAQSVTRLANVADRMLRAIVSEEGFSRHAWEFASDMVDELAKEIDKEDLELGQLFRDNINADNLA